MADRVIFPRTESEYAQLYRVRHREIVISSIAASYGSIAVVPLKLDGMVVSKEYTVLKARPGYDERVIQALLRCDEIRAEMLLRTIGANRTKVRWEAIKDIAFPYPDAEIVSEFVRHMEEAGAARDKALQEEAAAKKELGDKVRQNAELARMFHDAFKPPKEQTSTAIE